MLTTLTWKPSAQTLVGYHLELIYMHGDADAFTTKRFHFPVVKETLLQTILTQVEDGLVTYDEDTIDEVIEDAELARYLIEIQTHDATANEPDLAVIVGYTLTFYDDHHQSFEASFPVPKRIDMHSKVKILGGCDKAWLKPWM